MLLPPMISNAPKIQLGIQIYPMTDTVKKLTNDRRLSNRGGFRFPEQRFEIYLASILVNQMVSEKDGIKFQLSHVKGRYLYFHLS